MSLKKFKTK